MTMRSKIRFITPWLLLCGALLLIKESVYLVPQGAVAVLKSPFIHSRLPKLQTSPGLYGKWPWIQTVSILDQRAQIVHASVKLAATATQPALTLDYAVTWRISDPLRYIRKTNALTQPIQEQVLSTINSELTKALDRLSLREKLQATENTNLRYSTLQALNLSFAAWGITLQTLNFVGLQFVQVDPDNLFNTLRIQQAQKALQQRDLGEQHAALIRNQAEQAAAQLLEKSRQKALALRYHGDEEAAKIYYDAYHRDPAFAAFYLKLKAYQAAWVANAKNDNVLILHLEDSLLKKDQNTGTSK